MFVLSPATLSIYIRVENSHCHLIMRNDYMFQSIGIKIEHKFDKGSSSYIHEYINFELDKPLPEPKLTKTYVIWCYLASKPQPLSWCARLCIRQIAWGSNQLSHGMYNCLWKLNQHLSHWYIHENGEEYYPYTVEPLYNTVHYRRY